MSRMHIRVILPTIPREFSETFEIISKRKWEGGGGGGGGSAVGKVEGHWFPPK